MKGQFSRSFQVECFTIKEIDGHLGCGQRIQGCCLNIAGLYRVYWLGLVYSDGTQNVERRSSSLLLEVAPLLATKILANFQSSRTHSSVIIITISNASSFLYLILFLHFYIFPTACLPRPVCCITSRLSSFEMSSNCPP